MIARGALQPGEGLEHHFIEDRGEGEWIELCMASSIGTKIDAEAPQGAN